MKSNRKLINFKGINSKILRFVGFLFGVLLLISINQGYVVSAPTPPAAKDRIEAKPITRQRDQKVSSKTARNALVEGLIRIGSVGIAQGDDAALNVYFADGYVLHGSGGNLNFKQVKENFRAYRTAFTDFKVSRDQIVVEGNMVACRTTMSGIFERDFTRSPVGTVRATGKPVSFDQINIFRYTDGGQLAEEWVRRDNYEFLQQLGAKNF
jgi:predicted ester cyclase